MIPTTRKERYINQIVGGGDTAPVTPITEEEFFFSDILGEVNAPYPITNIEKYLAKIANKYSGELPEPITRIERFIARAAGMDISVPTPVTREEIFWSNYSAIVDFEVEGIPPLTYKAVAGVLNDYRIYGNTANGESVGDLETTGEHAGEYKVPVTVEGKNLLPNTATSLTTYGVTLTVNSDGSVTCNGTALQTIEFPLVTTFSLLAGNYRLIGTPSSGSVSSYYLRAWYYNSGSTVWLNDTGNGYNFTLTDVATMRSSIVIRPSQVLDNITFYPMIRKADITDDTYEPYHAPVTVPIYLPEQIRKVGDEAEYIDYSEQKLHRIGAEDIDVTLPALPVLPGTNTLTVGTEVQPSNVYIKYKERKYE